MNHDEQSNDIVHYEHLCCPCVHADIQRRTVQSTLREVRDALNQALHFDPPQTDMSLSPHWGHVCDGPLCAICRISEIVANERTRVREALALFAPGGKFEVEDDDGAR